MFDADVLVVGAGPVGLVLLRPDLPIARRGDQAPADCDRIACVVTGKTFTHQSRETTSNAEAADA